MEHPILFRPKLVRKILAGEKTETRRIMKSEKPCPYGYAGDYLWVREAWGIRDDGDVIYRATYAPNPGDGKIRWRPSIHMPRKYSRILLEVMQLHCEHLQDITDEDAINEGVDTVGITPRLAFYKLWDEINGERPGCSFNDNPFVWVVKFKMVAEGAR